MAKVSSVGKKLIKLIPRFPELYNPEHELANDKTHGMLLWETISEELDLPVNVLKREWKKLQALQKVNAEEWKKRRKPSFWTMNDENLAFYESLLYDESDGENADNTSIYSGPTLSVISEEDSSKSGSARGSTSRKRAAKDFPLPIRKSDRVLRSQVNSGKSFERKVAMPKKSRTPNDPIRSFFESMALTVATFPEDLRVTTKEQISKIVSQANAELFSTAVR